MMVTSPIPHQDWSLTCLTVVSKTFKKKFPRRQKSPVLSLLPPHRQASSELDTFELQAECKMLADPSGVSLLRFSHSFLDTAASSLRFFFFPVQISFLHFSFPSFSSYYCVFFPSFLSFPSHNFLSFLYFSSTFFILLHFFIFVSSSALATLSLFHFSFPSFSL